MPSVFAPEPLKCSATVSFPATEKQLSLLKRLVKQKGLDIELDKKKLTKNEASQMIERILSGNLG